MTGARDVLIHTQESEHAAVAQLTSKRKGCLLGRPEMSVISDTGSNGVNSPLLTELQRHCDEVPVSRPLDCAPDPASYRGIHGGIWVIDARETNKRFDKKQRRHPTRWDYLNFIRERRRKSVELAEIRSGQVSAPPDCSNLRRWQRWWGHERTTYLPRSSAIGAQRWQMTGCQMRSLILADSATFCSSNSATDDARDHLLF
jgi:hypothetical protein